VIQQIKTQQHLEAKKMHKSRGWVEQKKNKIADLGNKLLIEQNKI
jgi:hypothetical protein